MGGVETLFGTQSMSMSEYACSVGKSVLEINKEYNRLNAAQDLVMRNADEAYKSAGMSANEYMETVTSFSAALIASMDGDTLKAAEKADQAIVDMADNANKMGSSMESIQNAYQGFAKQNYTMLDNLKLGYGGTKEEMQRLLEDAEKISGIEYNLDSYADVVDAIHVIQTEMGITGTTAKEAATTISGSAASMKAAWNNLLVGIADDSQDFDVLVDNLVDSVATFGENILPRVETALEGVGELVEELLPVIIDRIPGLINEVLPDLLQSGINMVSMLFRGIQENLPAIIDGALLIIQQLTTTFIEALPQIIQMGMEIITQLAYGIAEALPELIPAMVETMLTIVENLLDNIDMLIDAAVALIMGLAQGLIEALPILIEKIPIIIVKLADAIIENSPTLLVGALKLIATLAEGLISYLPLLINKIPELITTLKNKFLECVVKFKDVGKSIVEGIASGITEKWDWLVGKAKELADSVFNAAKSALGINSPSKKFKWLAQMCVAGWDSEMDNFSAPNVLTNGVEASFATMQANVQSGNWGSPVGGAGGFNQVINVNQPISTPDELARAIRVESRYGLMRGVPVGVVLA